jgi:hypothetical protein
MLYIEMQICVSKAISDETNSYNELIIVIQTRFSPVASWNSPIHRTGF